MAGEGQVQRDARRSTRSCGTSTRSTTWPGPSSSREPRPGDTLEVEVLALTPGDVGLDGVHRRRSGCCRTTSPIRCSRSSTSATAGGDRRPGRRGADRSLPRDDGCCARRRGVAFPRSRPTRAAATSTVAISSRLDALAADLVRGRALLVRRRARGSGRRRGVRQRDRMRDGSDARFRCTSARSLPRRSASPRRRRPGAHYGTMGIDPDLMEGAPKAVRNMIAWLVEEHGLTREDAYVLAASRATCTSTRSSTPASGTSG